EQRAAQHRLRREAVGEVAGERQPTEHLGQAHVPYPDLVGHRRPFYTEILADRPFGRCAPGAVLGSLSIRRRAMHTIETVRGSYAAFGRGDVPAILDKLADQVDWEYGWSEHEVPWLMPRKDKQGVAAFFAIAGTALAFERFEVSHILGDERLVVALIDHDA